MKMLETPAVICSFLQDFVLLFTGRVVARYDVNLILSITLRRMTPL